MHQQPTLLCVSVALLFALPVWAESSRGSRAALPLRVSDTGRFLVDQKGSPFLVVGDTPWSLIVQLGEEDIEHYLADRQQKGFNSIIANLIEHKFCSDPPNTRAGLAPFEPPGDLSAPNPRYFDFAHDVVKRAGDRGIVVWLAPAYLGAGGGGEGWFQEMKASGPQALRDYGRFVGQRFRDLPNIVWVLGGDYAPAAADRWTVAEVAEGIREADPEHLLTAHASRRQSAAPAFGDPTWLDVNTSYTDEANLYRLLAEDYHRRPLRPFVLIEAIYEGEHNAAPELIRRQAYVAMLSGACGQFFGNNPIWHFDGPGLYPSKTTWQEALDEQGSWDMSRVRELFARRAWHRLVPDAEHKVVTDSHGQDLATIVTARTPDAKLALAYVPSAARDSRSLTVNLGQFARPVRARWYDPTNARFTAVGDKPMPNRGPVVLRVPGENGTGASDWVLVLEAK